MTLKKMLTNNTDIVWIPHKGSQELALSCPADVILYHGTRGPGKTDTQLMRFRRYVGQGYGQYLRGVIFDREYKNLDDLVSKSRRWFPKFNDGAKFKSAKSDYKWVWPDGEELLFRVVKKESDYWAYHGQEFPWIGWNELTKYPNDILFEAMMSCNRSSFLPHEHPLIIDGDIYARTNRIVLVKPKHKHAREYILPKIPLEVFATTNPFGIGHNWVKKRFIDGQPLGSIKKSSILVFNPQTQQKEEITVTQSHIFGSYRENRNLDPKYVAELVSITDENKRKAWLMGSWDVTSGGMFDDLWSNTIHKVRSFKIPKSWRIDRSFDWGSSKPFSVGWYAKSDGSSIIYPDGTVKRTVRGDIFRIAEWYGCEKGRPNTGLKILAKEIAAGIVERELKWGIHDRVKPGAADTSIWDLEDGNSIAQNMEKNVLVDGILYQGVSWERANKNPGSRIIGWQKVREYLYNALPNAEGTPREYPAFYIFDNCPAALDLFPSLPRDEIDPDDIDTDAEDHIGDEIRYRLMDEAMPFGSGKTTGQN